MAHMYERKPEAKMLGLADTLYCRWCKRSKVEIDGEMNEYIEKICKK
jgi:hypothetical protein